MVSNYEEMTDIGCKNFVIEQLLVIVFVLKSKNLVVHSKLLVAAVVGVKYYWSKLNNGKEVLKGLVVVVTWLTGRKVSSLRLLGLIRSLPHLWFVPP